MTPALPDDPVQFFRELLRRDFCTFLRKAFPHIAGGSPLLWNWHLDAIAWELERVKRGQSRNLIVNLPPRNLKSITISIAWVAWMLGQNPTMNFVCVSYSGELASKLARDCRSIMMSSWYREVFPRTMISNKRSASHDFETTAGGGRLATSPTGTLTGRGGDIIIIDDPIKPEEAGSATTRQFVNDWYRSTLASRLNDKSKGAIILVMQRLHEFDLAGMLLDKRGWQQLDLPAIATKPERILLTRGRSYLRTVDELLHPAREGRDALDVIKASMGSILFSAQYQQDPIPAVGNIIKRSQLQSFDPATIDLNEGQIVMSLDTASKDNPFSDYSAFVIARLLGKSVHVIQVVRERLQFPALKARTIELARLHGAKVLLIEDAASGQQLIQSLRAEEPRGVPSPIARRPEGDKVSRVIGVTAMIEAGRLHLPQSADWLGDYTAELLGFPTSRYDDQVDATAQLLIWVQEQEMFRAPEIAGPIEMSDEVPNDPDGLWIGDPWGA